MTGSSCKHKKGKNLFKVTLISAKKQIGRPKNKIEYPITRCQHTERKYYAKGMCKECYNHFGRPSFATKCPHTDQMVFAKEICYKCYNSLRYYKICQQKKIKQLENQQPSQRSLLTNKNNTCADSE